MNTLPSSTVPKVRLQFDWYIRCQLEPLWRLERSEARIEFVHILASMMTGTVQARILFS